MSGRGELHLSVLIETMRREGYELAVSRPEVIIKDIDGVPSEPIEQLVVDMEEAVPGRRDGAPRRSARASSRTWSRTARAACAWNT